MKSVLKKPLGKALLSENGLPKPINILKMTPSKMAALVAPNPTPRPLQKGKNDLTPIKAVLLDNWREPRNALNLWNLSPAYDL